jgi:hypothetical protein
MPEVAEINALSWINTFGVEPRCLITLPLYFSRQISRNALESILKLGSDRGGISRILQLSQHLLIAEDLRGMAEAESKDLPQQSRLLNGGHQQDIFGQHRFNQ